jgi:hypothetical protein
MCYIIGGVKMPRTKEISINEKTVELKEFRVKELEALIDEFKDDFESLTSIKTSEDFKKNISVLLRERLPKLLPGVSVEDIENAYPSEIETALDGFVEVNFTGLRRLLGQLFNISHLASR